jgi:hypothetical protein
MVASDFMSEEAIDDSSQSSPPHSRSRPPPVLGAIDEGEEEETDNQNALPFFSQRPQISLGMPNPSSLIDPSINLHTPPPAPIPTTANLTIGCD